MNETNDGIIVEEENDLGEDAIQIEEHDQYQESEEHDQSMELPRISNYGTGVDRLEMIFYGKIYVHGQHRQLLVMKQKYDTSKDIDIYMSLEKYVMFTQMSSKKGIKQFE